MSEHVRIRWDGPQAVITLDRPPLNVVTIDMLRALDHALASADDRPDVRVVRIEGAGKAFSAGVDVADHVGERIEPMMAALTQLFLRFERMTKPTVAAVHGLALGGGMELAAGTDLCVAAPDASFAQPEIRLGLFAPPASVLLPRILGERRALGMLLSGDRIGADEALRCGFVNAVLADDDFHAAAAAWCSRLAELSGAALRLAKEAVRLARGRSAAEAHRLVERLYLDRLMRTADAAEGLASFQEKRAPRWLHR